MKIRFLNKTIEHQRFGYNPMYYSERREKLKRIKESYSRLEKEDVSSDQRKLILRENIKEGWSRAQYREVQQRSSNIRIVLLIALIVALGYFIFNGVDEVDTVVKKLW